MTSRKLAMAGLFVALIAGCSSTPPQKAEPVTVSGTVLLPSGQPARDITVNFFPTSSDQIQGGAQIKGDGKFTAKLTPGKYTYGFEGTSVKSIPAKYHSNDANNSFEVPASGTSDLTLKLTN